MTPKILLACTCPWLTTARLALAFGAVGCTVEAVCPRGHAVSRVRSVSRINDYHALAPLRSIGAAITRARPDLVIPCDDPATTCLHQLHDRAVRGGKRAAARRALLERSLGGPSGFAVARARGRLIALAGELGIRVPAAAPIRTAKELADWLARNGVPAVVKADGTYGGSGVRIVRSPAEAEAAFRRLSAPPSPLRAIVRAAVNRDTSDLLPCVRRVRPLMSVQRFVFGDDANSTVACWKGKVLAAIDVTVLRTCIPNGPASVVRVVENREMTAAVEHLVSRLELSGLFGFDFIIEKRTRDAHLIEMNPRATQLGHLRLGVGRDLAASLRAILSGEPTVGTASVTDNDVIALFPQEWLRDPSSDFLRTAYHDVPWDAPDLVRAALSEDLRFRTWSAISSAIRTLRTRPFDHSGEVSAFARRKTS